MIKLNFLQLERQLQRLLEERLTRRFAGRVRLADVAAGLARAMHASLRAEGEVLLAPTEYIITLHPADHDALVSADDALDATLSDLLMQIAVQMGLTLKRTPSVSLRPDETARASQVGVTAQHRATTDLSTKALESVTPPVQPTAEHLNPQLIVNGSTYIPLNRPVINIGRRHDNHIVLDSLNVSRTHAQLRLRHGRYVLYDLGSTGGTLVNNHKVGECVLKPGDVIRLGDVTLLYIEDEQSAEPSQTEVNETQPIQPVTPPDSPSTPFK